MPFRNKTMIVNSGHKYKNINNNLYLKIKSPTQYYLERVLTELIKLNSMCNK